MSLLIYLIAFLYQVSLRPANRLTIESISVIFGPSLLGTSRSEGQTSNGINSSKASAEGLRWLLENWEDSLSQDLLDEDYDCFASPFVGQTAWSTPNLLGEMQTDPLIQGNLQGEVQSTKDRDLPEVSHSSDAATGRDHSRSLPQEANTINSPLNNDPVKLNDGSQLLPEGASALEPASLPGDSNMPEGVKTASTNRSVSAFAKGERFSDEDINSDPNAAQLFGSLSQLFSTERRKAKVYQQQVEELQQQQQVHLSTISALQAELSGSHATIGRLQTELSDFESKLEQLQNESVRSTALHHQQQEALDATRKDLEHQKEQHASLLQQIEEDKARLHQQHAEAVRARDQEHESQMQEQARSLQEQHAKDESDRTNALSSSHRQELDRLQTEFDAEKGQLNDEIRRLREAVQVSDRERDGAREHLQRIRALLDAAQ